MIGIAIINFKTFEKTIDCIESIRNNLTLPYKIYLLDNNSQNESAAILKKYFYDSKDVELIISNVNEGYARGNNICIKRMIHDKCDFGIISNNDIICTNNSIELLIKDLENHSDLLLVGPKLFSPSNIYQCSAKKRNIDNWTYLLNSLYISSLWNKSNSNDIFYEKSESLTYSQWVSGAFFAFSIENMKKIGLLDPHTFLFFEEAILSKRAEKYSLKLGFNPKSHVIHDHAYSSGGGLNIETRIAADQSERYFFRNYTKVSKFFFSFMKIARYIEVFYSYGKRKKFKEIKMYLKSMN